MVPGPRSVVFSLHDQGSDCRGPYAWLGTYVRQPYRRYTMTAWTLLRQICEEQGLGHILVAACQSNRPVQILLCHAGFTKLGRYVDWGYFRGTLKTVLLYTLRSEDQATAWVSAEQRALRLRRRAHVMDVGIGSSRICRSPFADVYHQETEVG